MGDIDWFTKLRTLFWAGNDLVTTLNHYLATRFGTVFQLAVDWVLLGLVLVVLLRLFKLSFDVLRYVLVPSVIVSGIVSSVSPLSFLYVMPLAMGAGTVFLLFKS